MEHDRIQMAIATGVDLDRSRADRFGTLSVKACRQIAVDYSQAELADQPTDGVLNKRRLARAWRSHEINSIDTRRIQPGPIFGGQTVIRAEYFLDNWHLFCHSSASKWLIPGCCLLSLVYPDCNVAGS